MVYPIKTYTQACKKQEYDFLTLASAPYNENCLKAGSRKNLCILECSLYIEQLQRKYGNPPADCEFFIMENIHDAGIYYEAAVFYKSGNEIAQTYALRLEAGDGLWDSISLQKLSTSDHPNYQSTYLITC